MPTHLVPSTKGKEVEEIRKLILPYDVEGSINVCIAYVGSAIRYTLNMLVVAFAKLGK